MSEQVQTLDFDSFSEFIRGELAVVQFSAPWCGPCRSQTKALQELAASPECEGVTFDKVDIEDEPMIAGDQNISALPTVVIFSRGEHQTNFVGYKPAHEILNIIQVLRKVASQNAAEA